MINLEEKINLLKRIAHRFKEEQIEWALGGSMMLYFKKIVPFFDDIDLMIFFSDVDRVRSILLVMGELKPENPKAKYQTKSFMEFIIEGIDVDVMAGFAISGCFIISSVLLLLFVVSMEQLRFHISFP